MTLESVIPYPEGSAEHAATYLTTRGLGCVHPVKYHADGTNQAHSKYPSRLGFFHFTAKEPTISFLDTKKLCNACLDFVVPNGFNFWSTYCAVHGASAGEQQTPKSQWLNMAASSDSYPPLVQAGTEGFTHASLAVKGFPNRSTTPPVVLHIPKVPGAKKAWDWLQTERKPFYIDQLHLIKGWSLIVETRAKADSLIAERAGIGYRPETQLKTKERKRTSANKGTVLLENGPRSSATTPLKSKKKTKVAKVANEKLSALPVATNLTGGVAKPSDVPLVPAESVFEALIVNQGVQHTSIPSTPSKVDKVSTKIKSTERPAKKSSSTGERSKTPEKKKKTETTSVESSSLGGSKKPLKFSFTGNWGSHDLIPFDGPTVPLKLSDYKLQAQNSSRPVIDPGSNYSLEKLMSGRKPTDGKSSLADLISRIRTPGTAAYRASGIEKLKTRPLESVPKAKGMHELSPNDPNTKTKKPKGDHNMPFQDKAHKEQPTKDKPLMPKTTPAKQQPLANEPAQSVTPKKDVKEPKGEFQRHEPQGFKPAKAPKIELPQEKKPVAGQGFANNAPEVRLPQHHTPLPVPSFQLNSTPKFEKFKPRYPPSESMIGKIKNRIGDKVSFSHDTGHDKPSKPVPIQSSNTGPVNIHNHYTETSMTEVSVTNTLYMNQDDGDGNDVDEESDVGEGSDGGSGSNGSDSGDGNDSDGGDGSGSDGNDGSGDDGSDDGGNDRSDSGDGNDSDGGSGGDGSGDDGGSDSGGDGDGDGDGNDSDSNDGNGSDSDGSDSNGGDGGNGNGSDSGGSDGSDSGGSNGSDDNDDGQGDSSGDDGYSVKSYDGNSGGDSDDDGYESGNKWNGSGNESDD